MRGKVIVTGHTVGFRLQCATSTQYTQHVKTDTTNCRCAPFHYCQQVQRGPYSGHHMYTVIIATVHNNTADAKSDPLLWDTYQTTEELFGEAQPTMAASEKPVDTFPDEQWRSGCANNCRLMHSQASSSAWC